MTAHYEKKLSVVKTQLQHELKDKQKILSQRIGDVAAKSDLGYVSLIILNKCVERYSRGSLTKNLLLKKPIKKKSDIQEFDNSLTGKRLDMKQFLNSDKQRVLELFLRQENVLVALYDKVFPNAHKSGRNSTLNGSTIMGAHSAVNTTVDGVLELQRDILDALANEDTMFGLNSS